MGRVRVFALRLLGSVHLRQFEESLDAELGAHVELLTEENIRRGLTPEQARSAARREFGGLEQAKELYREQRGLPFLDSLLGALRFALRTLAKRPGFAVVATLTLALGMGATTAVLRVVDRTLFRSLPYAHDERLVSFGLIA